MPALSAREIEVAGLVAEAWTNKRIAVRVGISERRVRALVSSIARKLGADLTRDERVQVARIYTDSEGATASTMP